MGRRHETSPDRVGLGTAISFLTVLPVPARLGGKPDLGRAAPWFPVVGLVVAGLVIVLDMAMLLGGWNVPVRSVISLAASVMLTGMLHLDGLMDTCDGLASGRRGAAMLEVMRDSRVGAAGAAGGCVALLAWYVFLSQFGAYPLRAVALIQTLVAGRLAMVLVAPMVGGGGVARMGSMLHGSLNGVRTAWAAASAALILGAALAAVAMGWGAGLALKMLPRVALAYAGGLGGGWLAGARLSRRLDGLTGDALGAVCVVSELAVLLVLGAGV
jgi:adenosylcobinamide-GDP ribazoletransferase